MLVKFVYFGKKLETLIGMKKLKKKALAERDVKNASSFFPCRSTKVNGTTIAVCLINSFLIYEYFHLGNHSYKAKSW